MANADREIGLETFSRIVESIYDCAFDPGRWDGAVRSIAELSGSQLSLLAVHDYANGHSELACGIGYEERFIRLHEEKYAPMNPFLGAMRVLPVGVVNTRAMLVDDTEFYESRFYREWVEPQGYDDALMFNVLKTDHRLGWWTAHRLKTCPRYGDAELRLARLLAPHFCRAVAISDALNLKTIRSDALEATLDGLAAGVYLVDRFARVIYTNRAAERQIGSGTVLSIEDERLAPRDDAARARLTKAVAEAIADESAASSGITLALPGVDGGGLVATLLPIARGERQNLCGAFAATVAVFVQDPVSVPAAPGEAFAKIYGLIGGELRVLLAMAPGLSVKEAAEMLGVSETTAKTHLQHIYAKTGTARQTELMHLFRSSAPPVCDA